MRVQIDGTGYDLPDKVVDTLHLRRYHDDDRRKPTVICLRFTAAEAEQLRAAHKADGTLCPLSPWLHDCLMEHFAQRAASAGAYQGAAALFHHRRRSGGGK